MTDVFDSLSHIHITFYRDKWSDQEETMSSFQVVDCSPGSSVSLMETSNFAHVIFQNVGKSFLPQAPLECRYTLTPYIAPHPKDWVGIFKVRNKHTQTHINTNTHVAAIKTIFKDCY